MKLHFILQLASFCLGRMTPEQRHQLKIEAHKADEDIYFLPFDEIKPALEAQRTTMLFLGAIWCHNTQRFTPKYLQVQQWVEQERLFEKGFRMAKVECAVDKEKFCVEEFKIDGFPTILVFVDGKLLHEYPYEDESEPVYNYIKKLVADNPPDPSKVYPDWGSETIAGSPILNNIPVDSSVVNSAHKVLDEHHHAEEAIDAVPVQSSNLYEKPNTLFILLAGFSVVFVAGLILYRWRKQSQYAKVSSHLAD